MFIWHVTIGVYGRLALFNDEAMVRRCVQDLVRLHGDRLVVFCFVDDHLHVVIVFDGPAVALANAVGRSIRLSLRSRLGVSIEPARPRAVVTVDHLENVVGYVLGQPLHHRVSGMGVLWSGSCFADLIGARDLPGLRLQLARVLPRFAMKDVLASVELPQEALVPAGRELVRRLGPRRLAQAAAAAVCAPPELSGNGPVSVRARAATSFIGRRAGLSAVELATALGITPSAARKLRVRGAPRALLEAVVLRLGMEDYLERQSGGRPKAA